MSAFTKAAPSLIAAAGGIALVWAWFNQPTIDAVRITLVPVAFVALGLILDDIGRRRVKTAPVSGLRLIESYLLVPIALGALASAGVLVLAIWLEPDPNASTQVKKVSAAIAGAVTAFVATTFLKGLEDFDGTYVGPRVEQAFSTAFAGRWTGADEAKSKPVFEWDWKGVSGWGWSARAARAKQIAAQL